ncbi:hypothetical protein pb186bvf_011677 [Paramecium bursaria]
MDKFLNIFQKLFGQRFLSDIDEINYLSQKKDYTAENQAQILRLQDDYTKFSLACLTTGFVLCFTSRRFLTKDLKMHIQFIHDAVIVLLPVGIGQFYSIKQALSQTQKMRKQFLQQPDIEYINHLCRKYKKYSMYQDDEYEIYKDLLNPEEFKEWKIKYEFDITQFKE